jgi:hypothetical protein
MVSFSHFKIELPHEHIEDAFGGGGAEFCRDRFAQPMNTSSCLRR